MDSLPHIPHDRNGYATNYPDLTALRRDMAGRTFAHPDELDLLDLGVPSDLLNDFRTLADHIADYHPADVVEAVIVEIIDEPVRVLNDGTARIINPALEPFVVSLAAQMAALGYVREVAGL